MDIRGVPRAVVERSLRLARLPADTALRRLPEDQPLRIAVDRADATVRDLAGRVLGDTALQDQARRQRAAANERQRALQLRAEAKLRSTRADTEFREDKARAEQRRENAEATAAERERRAEADRQEAARRLEDRERNRKGSVRKARATIEESIDSQAQRTRLEELDEEGEAIAESNRALETRSEATRLAEAAARAKEERKTG